MNPADRAVLRPTFGRVPANPSRATLLRLNACQLAHEAANMGLLLTISERVDPLNAQQVELTVDLRPARGNY